MKQFRYVIYGLIVIAASMLIAAANASHANEGLSTVQYKLHHLKDGSDLVQLEDIRQRLDEAFDSGLEGTQLKDVDLAQIESILKKDPFVAQTHVYLNARRQLYVEIFQRTAIARIVPQGSAAYYLDHMGTSMPLSKEYTPKVPICMGYLPAKRMNNATDSARLEHLSTCEKLINSLHSDEYLNTLIESIHIDRNFNMTMYCKLGNFEIRLNGKKDFIDQLDHLKIWMDQAFKPSDWKELEYIDLSVTNQVIAGRTN